MAKSRILMIGTLAMMLIALPLLAACGGDDETEEPTPTQEATPTPTPSPTAEETPTPEPSPEPTEQTPAPAGPETWTQTVIGEETVDGVEAWVYETSFDVPPVRLAASGKDVRYQTYKAWVEKDTLQPLRVEVFTEIWLAPPDPESWLALNSITTSAYQTEDYGAPLSEGKSWVVVNSTELDPPISQVPDKTLVYEVTGMEEVTVPEGTHNCYAVEVRAQADDSLIRTEYWSADSPDYLVPVKNVEVGGFLGVETKELTTYDAEAQSWAYTVTFERQEE